MKSYSKAQVANEFFMYSALFLIILTSAYFSIFYIQSSEIYNKEALYVKEFGESFASHTNLAMSIKNLNYTIKFDRKIMNDLYALYFKPYSMDKPAHVLIVWNKNNLSYSYPIANKAILPGDKCIQTHSTSSGENYYEINTSKGILTFYNDGVSIILSQGCT